ncbi:DUF2142 domain-containing protein [Salinibacterium sp.]|uniref:DUF2142 domain-containing protein n=1 Tax=Salinibacterium sp. TaxID=1915057 RepID=UPI00286B68F1|nr:DUF2142 domain-containing protein [Salinibacterium sp.]
MFAPVFAFVALISWGLSSPVGSSPDDEFHLASIWCGQENSRCAAGETPGERMVSPELLIDAVCYAYKPGVSAECQGEDFGSTPGQLIESDRGNFSALYPPVFYAAMSLLAGSNVETSVMLMRIANAALFVGLMTTTFLLLPQRRRLTLVWASVITAVPLGMFIIPSTNPSSWAILSAALLWISLLGYFESTGKRKVGLAVVALVAAVMGAGARADAALYAILAIALVMLITARRDAGYWIQAILPASLIAVAGLLYLTANQSAALTAGLPPVDGGIGLSPIGLIASNLLLVPSLWAGVFGSWNLGWLDTALPPTVWIATLGSFCAVAYVGIGSKVRRKTLALAIVLAALWLVPTVVLVRTNALVGSYVQPRYILPLMILLAGFALLQRRSTQDGSDTPLHLTSLQALVPVVALSVANSISLHTNIRRYVTGTDLSGVNLDTNHEWWWSIPTSPMFVWIVGSISFALLLFCLCSLLIRRREASTVMSANSATPDWTPDDLEIPTASLPGS